MKLFLTATLTICLALFVTNLTDAQIECYSCTAGAGCTSNEGGSSCSGNANTATGCSYCLTSNQTNPNAKSVIKSSCVVGIYDPATTDSCDNNGNNGQPITCITSCNTTLCNYDCSSATTYQLTKPCLHYAILTAIVFLIIHNITSL